jgi:hypothetical protein
MNKQEEFIMAVNNQNLHNVKLLLNDPRVTLLKVKG